MNTFYITNVDKKKKTITTYELTDELVEKIKDLLEIFKPNPNIEESLGFKRLLSFSKYKMLYLSVVFEKNGLSQRELKLFLENLSENDFKDFKKSIPNFKNRNEVREYLTRQNKALSKAQKGSIFQVLTLNTYIKMKKEKEYMCENLLFDYLMIIIKNSMRLKIVK